ncbi:MULTISPECIES: hypothetical protein [Rhodococcus]|nr:MULTISPECIES: hypothetical protein [Rhodococcus]MDI9908593.1 hypothetical protein [Rhodococcus sp. IEGM 1406]
MLEGAVADAAGSVDAIIGQDWAASVAWPSSRLSISGPARVGA